ncbi:hypothetical protein [Nonomuraea guangzhouensis]|uniref:WXG100 family type VII secretion target n=1 Tax=Nonomuraea guangzhouensis TaxID=1291555 RepID=A0ABW4GY01_9ACTN|nr:hypothetical protein [Nonomuraea guangzhouensis]
MSPAQMKATLAKVDADVRASIQHTENLRRSSSILDQRWAFDESRCTDSRCSSGCSCGRTR